MNHVEYQTSGEKNLGNFRGTHRWTASTQRISAEVEFFLSSDSTAREKFKFKRGGEKAKVDIFCYRRVLNFSSKTKDALVMMMAHDLFKLMVGTQEA